MDRSLSHYTCSGIVAAVGVFDGVHRGHVDLLRQVCKVARQCESTAMVFTFDVHPLELIRPEIAPKWLTLPARRNALLRSCAPELEVVQLTFDDNLRQLTAAQFAEMLRTRYGVDRIVMGYDHSFGSDRLRDIEDYRRSCRMNIDRAQKFTLPERPELTVSSSSARKAIAESDFKLAHDILGRHYTFGGTVVSGRRDGRRIGFPTANIDSDSRQLLPAEGVYAAHVCIDGMEQLPAMLNIGRCPTLTNASRRTAEAHILGQIGDIYGHIIEVEPVVRLRGEKCFAGIDELKAQLVEDQALTKKILGL